ncbi:hypothetical protein [Anaeromyxobacter paludicola]|uniref:Outer membrane protein beta-barrel domain-containing protein n=1 Tax=Anaeromyxobacter paludicola TaxID=2918171 RepID=A0ABM7X9V7_9BACT|nr:hypothetical protein [Anaeromyxobacter paludicola]BDG08627.1 hypothetical protein AMPC_17400 [Anaeromyxobacter paludicola]
MRPARLFLLAVLAMLRPVPAHADRGETYALLSVEPGVAGFSDPSLGRASSTQFRSELGLVGYYGLTNALHVGAAVRYATSSGLSFSPSAAGLPGGPTYPGTLVATDQAFSASALALYRFDSGYHLAPVLAGEVGYTTQSLHDVALVPQGTSYGIPLSSRTDSAPFARVSALVEWRFANRWVSIAGVAVMRTGLQSAPWQCTFPIMVGMIW